MLWRIDDVCKYKMNGYRSLLPPPNGTWELIRQMIHKEVNHRPWCKQKRKQHTCFPSSNSLYLWPQFSDLFYPSPVPSPLIRISPAIDLLWRMTKTFSDKKWLNRTSCFLVYLHKLFPCKLQLNIWSLFTNLLPLCIHTPRPGSIFVFKIIISILIIFWDNRNDNNCH